MNIQKLLSWITLDKMRKLAQLLQINVKNFSEMKKDEKMSVVLTLRLGIALPCATSMLCFYYRFLHDNLRTSHQKTKLHTSTCTSVAFVLVYFLSVLLRKIHTRIPLPPNNNKITIKLCCHIHVFPHAVTLWW